MATYAFDKISEGEEILTIRFKRFYTFTLAKDRLLTLGSYHIKDNALVFPDLSEKAFWNKFRFVLQEGMSTLTSNLTGKKVIYLDEDLGVPLLGTNEFGIIDRGSNIIEIKPNTGCNLNCTFCSVSEGINKKDYDYLVDPDFLLRELEPVVALKKHPVEINIGPQGEPLLYPDLVSLIKGLKEIANIATISMNSNGVLLTKQLIDELAHAGLDRINLSLHTLDETLAKKIMGNKAYSVTHLVEQINYCKGKIAVLFAPVMIKGVNEELKDVVELSKEFSSPFPKMGIQNYLHYKGGRIIAKEMQWDDFFNRIKALENETGEQLMLKTDANPFHIFPEQTLPKPFLKGEVITADIKMPGRFSRDKIAVAKDRAITIRNCPQEKGSIKIKLIRDKHNIFSGVPLR
ncbi:MAG: radical SAM protein [Candidatus Woesearchaeota archaeon]|nr:MAG: radical SAM protein [Candidatus Woesearchaeota archaeon]